MLHLSGTGNAYNRKWKKREMPGICKCKKEMEKIPQYTKINI
jgi:hypothetical protein